MGLISATIQRAKDAIMFVPNLVNIFVKDLYSKVKSWLLTAVTLGVIFGVLLWTSVFLYGSFYYSYMPAVLHTRDVNLQFSPECELNIEKCSFPSANLTLVPESQPTAELLARGQGYRVTLDLQMPETQANQDVGMFMVIVQLYSFHGKVIKEASRGTMLHYKSFLLQTLETLTYYPMYMMGFREQKQTIQVEMFHNFRENPYKPTMGAYIEVQSRRVHIYSMLLQIHARFTGLRYLLYHWPILMAMVGITTNMFFLMVITLLSWYNFTQPSESQSWEDGEFTWTPSQESSSLTGTLDSKDLMQDDSDKGDGEPECLAASIPREEAESKSSSEGWEDIATPTKSPDEELQLAAAEEKVAESIGGAVRQRNPPNPESIDVA